MKIALYGMPCAGKSTLMDRITDAKVINGSQDLRRICGGSFSELSEEEKHQVRIKYTEYINALNDEVIVSDGHYSFWKLLHLLRLTEICTISLFICIVLRKILRKDMLCQRKMLSLLASPLSR